MKWIYSRGGPLILMANDLLPYWDGGAGGDYWRACDVTDWLGVLDVGSGQALVVTGGPMETAHWLQGDCWLLVRWSCAPDEAAVTRHLERVPRLEFPAQALTVDFGSRSAVLFDSVASASRLEGEETLELELPHQTCEICTLDWKANEETNLILHSFKPAR